MHNSLQSVAAVLKEAGIQNSFRAARLLVQAVLSCPYEELLISHSFNLSTTQQALLEKYISERLLKKPLSRILGTREFWSLPFIISSAVLDPRPDSETLIEACLNALPDQKHPYRFLDLGTGSGCLLLALLKEYPNATGIGADLSEGALAIAEQNAHSLDMGSRAQFIKSSWTENVTGRFDLVISNPPYIREDEYTKLDPGVKNYDPKSALTAGEDGLSCYREIAMLLSLQPALYPLIVLEIGYGQESMVSDIFKKHDYTLDQQFEDINGVPRALVLKNTA